MPCIEVTLPAQSAATRAALASALTESFCAATGHDPTIVGVLFHQYAEGAASVGGRLWDGAGVPFLHVVVLCPRLRRSAKQVVVQAMTEAFSQAVGRPEWRPVLHLAEHPYDNVGVDGQLLSDRYEACAKRRFYYELPREE